MTYQNAYHNAVEELKNAGIEDAQSDAWILFEFATGMSRTRFWADGFSKMKPEEEAGFAELIERRKERIPVQHLTGVQEFMGLPFMVNEHVLVPRQDTEILIEEVEKILRPGMKVLDMCTGSGCIAISLKARNQGIECTAVDISKEALEVAGRNAEALHTDIEFLSGDMFENVEGRYDVIVSNPPYIPTKVIETLEEEVKLHDPFGALDGKEDGLFFYRILADKSIDYLNETGYLYMEIGHDQSEDVEKMLKDKGFEQVSTKKDLSGLDRVVSGMYNRHSK